MTELNVVIKFNSDIIDEGTRIHSKSGPNLKIPELRLTALKPTGLEENECTRNRFYSLEEAFDYLIRYSLNTRHTIDNLIEKYIVQRLTKYNGNYFNILPYPAPDNNYINQTNDIESDSPVIYKLSLTN
jgi:hypothetical protein